MLAELDLKAAAEGLGLPPPHKSGAGKRKGRSSSAGYKPHRETAEAKVSPPRQSTRVAEKQRLVRVRLISAGFTPASVYCVFVMLLTINPSRHSYVGIHLG